jgi:hypothetical protein
MGSCDKKTLARGAEESPLLKAVAREQVIKTQKAGIKAERVLC